MIPRIGNHVSKKEEEWINLISNKGEGIRTVEEQMGQKEENQCKKKKPISVIFQVVVKRAVGTEIGKRKRNKC